MQINKENYEAWFLDFWEDSLDIRGREELSRFLEAHPGLQDEFLDFKDTVNVKLEPDEQIRFDGKAGLQKPEIFPTRNINHSNFEEYIIAQLEGDLSDEDLSELEDFRQKNPQLVGEFELYSKTILQPGRPVVFPDKQQLKRYRIPVSRFRVSAYATVAAAILLIAFIIINPFKNIETGGNLSSQLPGNNIDNSQPEPLKPVIRYKINANTPRFSEPVMKILPESQRNELIASAFEIVDQQNSQSQISQHAATTKIVMTALPEIIPGKREMDLLRTAPVAMAEVKPRTEMDGVFKYLMIRDAKRADAMKEEERGAIGRIFANLTDQIFGGDEEQNSLLGQMAEMSRERIREVREKGPHFERIQTEDSKQTYFAINENFRIRISKGEKSKE